MSILTKEDRRDLVYAMRKSLLEQVRTKGVLTEAKRVAAENFVLNEATYEQLLNLVYNPEREDNYQPTEVLEKVSIKVYEQFLTKSKSKKKTVKEKKKIVKSQFGVAEGKAKAAWQAVKGVGKAAAACPLRQ